MPAPFTDKEKIVPFDEGDFIPLPGKSFCYRGILWSRSTLLRLRDQSRLKIARFRFTGKTKPRLYVLRESLDDFIRQEMASAFEDREVDRPGSASFALRRS